MNFRFLNKTKFKCWEELYSYIKSLSTTKDKGDAFEEFAFLFFEYYKDIYNIKQIYSEKEIPTSLRDKYKLESTDNGVDGLIITNEGLSIGYQVKFRSDNSSADYSELSTFWAESEYCDKRCIFSNCFELPKQAEKKKNQFQILLDTFLTLDQTFFESIYLLANNKPLQVIEKYKPRDYQKEIIDDVVKGFKENDRGKIICACGTGKTLTSLWIKEILNTKTTLFIVPSLALIRQTLIEWKKQCNTKFDHIVVCSDTTVNDFGDETNIENSCSSSIPVTTDANVLKDFLVSSSENKVVFSTYQSLDCVMSATLLISDFKFDLAIFDEAHRTAGTSDSIMFSLGLDDSYIKCKKRLFMTATERVVSPRIKKLANEKDYTIFSMDDKKVYGPVFSRLDFGKAIEKKIISDYKIILATISNSDIESLIKSNQKFTQNGLNTINTDVTLKQLILAKSIKNVGTNKIITYHATVNAAQNFIFGQKDILPFDDILNNIANYDNKSKFFSHVNGTMSSSTRSKIFDGFKKANISVMSNASCLTEGVDIPSIDAVYFVDPKNSIINIIQAIGRALRKSKDKTLEYSYIILPLLIDDSISNFKDIDPQKFDTLHNVIQALRDQDSRLKEEIDQLNLNIATMNCHHNTPTSHLSVWIPERFNLDEFNDSLSLRIADINKNSDNVSKSIETVEDRSSTFTRVFRTMGDYSLDGFESGVVTPTLNKFAAENSVVLKQNLVINHNNVSHSERLGIINIEKNGLCTLTDLGKKLKTNSITFKKLFCNQILKYSEFNSNTTSTLFPYRSFLKILLNFDKITRLEFLYAVYTLKGSAEKDINKAIETINELRSTYPNIDILSEENKKKVLGILNLKYKADFQFNDIWTSRTTTYNQYNYFKKHLEGFDNVLSSDSDSDKLVKEKNANTVIEQLLSKTDYIEKLSEEELKIQYKSNFNL